MPIAINETGTKGFLMWVRANQPKLYSEFLKHWNKPEVSGLSCYGLGDTNPLDPSVFSAGAVDPANTTSASPMSSSIADTIGSVFRMAGQAFLTKTQIDGQSKLMDAQLSRAKAGLPPLNIDPATYGLQPTVGVGLSSSLQSLLMYGGLAALGVWVLTSFVKHRK